MRDPYEQVWHHCRELPGKGKKYPVAKIIIYQQLERPWQQSEIKNYVQKCLVDNTTMYSSVQTGSSSNLFADSDLHGPKVWTVTGYLPVSMTAPPAWIKMELFPQHMLEKKKKTPLRIVMKKALLRMVMMKYFLGMVMTKKTLLTQTQQ